MKTLGLAISELTRNNNNRLFTSIKTKALENNCRLVIFEGRSVVSDSYADKQHNWVYKFIDNSHVDHLVITSSAVPATYRRTDFKREFQNHCHNPLITYYYQVPGCHSIRVNNAQGSVQLVEHLLNEHKYSKFIVVRGPVGDHDADERYSAAIGRLRQAELKHEVIEYQANWHAEEAIKVIKDVIAAHQDYEAIIFPNDETSIAALDYINHFAPELRNHFAIVGFDNTLNATNISPQLTTADHPHDQMAEKLFELLESEEVEDHLFDAKAIIRSSCGCEATMDDTIPTHKLYSENYNLQENIQALNKQDLFHKLTVALQHRSVHGCYISLYKSKPFSLDEKFYLPEYSEILYAYEDGLHKSELTGQVFRTRALLPNGIMKTDEGQCLLVQNLFYSNKHFGFVVYDISVGRVTDVEDLTANIATTLHMGYLVESMKRALRENERLVAQLTKDNLNLQDDLTNLQSISSSDEMTGALNRRGFHQQLEESLQEWKCSQVAFIFADMDKLKFINDNYGHEAGDQAICYVSDVLHAFFRKADIIGRVGGDEFVICAHVHDIYHIEQRIERIKARLVELNNSDQYPFSISISFGYHCVTVDETLDINGAIAKADELLYEQKAQINKP